MWKKLIDFFAKDHYKMILFFFLSTALLIFFSLLAIEISSERSLVFDEPILLFIHNFTSPFFNTFFTVVTHLGDGLYIIIVAMILSTYFAYKKKYQKALILLLSMGGIAVVNTVLKFLFQRDRPSLWTHMVAETNFSFPSGHAMISAGFAGVLVILFWNTKYRLATIMLAILGTLLVGISRLYLGVHYPSDVLAGWCVSVALVLSVSLGVKHFYAKRPTKVS